MSTTTIPGATAIATTVAAGLVALLAPWALDAQDDATLTGPELSGQRCVDLLGVADTRVVDSDTLIFYLKDGDILVNDLPYACPALRQDGAFLYRAGSSTACEVDPITVLSRIGAGFVPGAACALGRFHSVDRSEANRLLAHPGL